jgi:hypothetical protein
MCRAPRRHRVEQLDRVGNVVQAVTGLDQFQIGLSVGEQLSRLLASFLRRCRGFFERLKRILVGCFSVAQRKLNACLPLRKRVLVAITVTIYTRLFSGLEHIPLIAAMNRRVTARAIRTRAEHQIRFAFGYAQAASAQ